MPNRSISGKKVGIKTNEVTEDNNPSQGPKPERPFRNESLGEETGEGENTSRVTVSIKSYRNRLLDFDNLVGGVKYFVDGLRHAGLIHDDREEDIILEVSQIKVPKREDEKTVIKLTYP